MKISKIIKKSAIIWYAVFLCITSLLIGAQIDYYFRGTLPAPSQFVSKSKKYFSEYFGIDPSEESLFKCDFVDAESGGDIKIYMIVDCVYENKRLSMDLSVFGEVLYNSADGDW